MVQEPALVVELDWLVEVVEEVVPLVVPFVVPDVVPEGRLIVIVDPD